MAQDNFRSILTGSFSTPCAGNPTVAMIESGFKAAGLDARYINCDVKPENLGDAVRGARAQEWAGFNCSIPHKVAIIQHLDDLADSARLIGAVNCVKIESNGKLIGNNTDGQGFLASLKSVIEPAGKNVLLMGAGGAARAIAVELGLAKAAHISIYNVELAAAEEVAGIVNKNTSCKADAHLWTDDIKVPEGIDIVINATSIGFGDAEAIGKIDVSTLNKKHIVADVIPNPPNTKLLRSAAAQGCTTLHGLGMLVNQGKIGMDIFLGKELSADVMTATLKDIFGA